MRTASGGGPAQFQLTLGGVRDSAAQAATPMVIELKSDGEMVGVIPGASCALSGLASQFVAENTARLDVTLDDCKALRFNTRYTGHLAVGIGAFTGRTTWTILLASGQ
jgi:hypothetical protein